MGRSKTKLVIPYSDQRFPTDPAPKEIKDWTGVTMDTDLNFGSLRNTQVNMMAEVEAELEKLTILGESNTFPTIHFIYCSFIVYTHSFLTNLCNLPLAELNRIQNFLGEFLQ